MDFDGFWFEEIIKNKTLLRIQINGRRNLYRLQYDSLVISCGNVTNRSDCSHHPQSSIKGTSLKNSVPYGINFLYIIMLEENPNFTNNNHQILPFSKLPQTILITNHHLSRIQAIPPVGSVGGCYISSLIQYSHFSRRSERMLSQPPKPFFQSPSSESGKKIKNYVYHYCDLIGKGNFARVYRGLNTLTQEVVAIKIVSLDALKSKHLEELIFEEIRILQQMSHPNVVKFYEALLSDRNCYIVTELCNQGDLEERIKRKRQLTEGEMNKLIVDMYQGLKYLREMGVTHRDFKTANIFLHNGTAKIADFGLAKFYKERFKDLDIGSPLYMSPEGLIYNCYGEKTDIWAFGIIIYQLLHGETPFCHCQTEMELKSTVAKPLPESKFRKGIHSLLRQLINSLLEVNENKRPTVYELANDPYLKGLLNQNFQQQGILLKKNPFEKPLITINQSFSQPSQQQQQQSNIDIPSFKNGPIFRPNSLQSPRRAAKTEINNPIAAKIDPQKKEQRKISFAGKPEPKNIELGGSKNPPIPVPLVKFGLRVPTEQLRPNSTREQQRNKITVTYNEHPHLNSTMGLLRQRQFSNKTIETKESEDDRGHFLKGEFTYSHRNFNN